MPCYYFDTCFFERAPFKSNRKSIAKWYAFANRFYSMEKFHPWETKIRFRSDSDSTSMLIFLFVPFYFSICKVIMAAGIISERTTSNNGMKFRLKHTCDITQGVINRRVTWKAKAWFKPGNSRSNGLSTIVSRKGKNTKVGFACTSCVLEG